jgi:hypothetical protein
MTALPDPTSRTMEVRHTVQETETNKAAVCLDILTALPEWFARPQAVADYAQAVEALPIFGFRPGAETVGFLSLNSIRCSG